MNAIETIREEPHLEKSAYSNDINLRSLSLNTQSENSSNYESQVLHSCVSMEKDSPNGMVEAGDGGIKDQHSFSEGGGVTSLSWTGSTRSLSSLPHPEVQGVLGKKSPTSVTSTINMVALNRSVSALSTQDFARRFSQDWVVGAYRRLWVHDQSNVISA